jgi:hypothetical protein
MDSDAQTFVNCAPNDTNSCDAVPADDPANGLFQGCQEGMGCLDGATADCWRGP